MKMKRLILAHEGDDVAVRVYCLLRARHGKEAARLLSVDELILASRWSHRVVGGRTSTCIDLHDGSSLSDNDLGAVFNRLQFADNARFAGAQEDDRAYARMETFALLVSWLAGLKCPVVNPASPAGLSGRRHESFAWQLMAACCGLPVARLRFTTSARRYRDPALIAVPEALPSGVPAMPLASGPAWFGEAIGSERRSVLVAGRRAFCVDPAPQARDWCMPDSVLESCVRLADRAGQHLLHVFFAPVNGTARRWVFVSADAFPSLTTDLAITAIADCLDRPAGTPQ